jgi:hypothetical protein
MDARGASRVLNAVVNSVLNDGAPEHVLFVPAIKFLGTRPGYLFKTGDKGLGSVNYSRHDLLNNSLNGYDLGIQVLPR